MRMAFDAMGKTGDAMIERTNAQTDEKPDERIKRTDLTEEMQPFIRIVPDIHLPKTVDEHSHTKFRYRNADRADSTFYDQGYFGKITVDVKHHTKTKTARDDHARMCVAAP